MRLGMDTFSGKRKIEARLANALHIFSVDMDSGYFGNLTVITQ